MFRLILAAAVLASPVGAVPVTSTYFTFDYNMPDMAYVEGGFGVPGDAFPGFDLTLFIQFDTSVGLLPSGTYSSAMPGVYLELPDAFDWDLHDFIVEVAGQFVVSWSMDLAYSDGTGSSFGSDNGQDHVSVEPDTLFVSQSIGNWNSLAARQNCYDPDLDRPCVLAPPIPPDPQQVPLPAPAVLLGAALLTLIRRRSATE